MLTPLRSLLFNIWLPVTAILTGIVCFPTLLKQEWAHRVLKLYAAQALFMFRLLCGNRYRIKGRENLPEGAALVAAKHQSMWETLALALVLPMPIFVLKKELLDIPFFGWWCRAAGMIGIDRSAGASAMRVMLEKASREAALGRQIVIFPEGTRLKPGESGPYHPGVAGLYRGLGLPCVPVAHNSGQFWVSPGFNKYAGEITLSFLPPIPAGESRKAFMSHLQQVIETEATALAGTAEKTVK